MGDKASAKIEERDYVRVTPIEGDPFKDSFIGQVSKIINGYATIQTAHGYVAVQLKQCELVS